MANALYDSQGKGRGRERGSPYVEILTPKVMSIGGEGSGK